MASEPPPPTLRFGELLCDSGLEAALKEKGLLEKELNPLQFHVFKAIKSGTDVLIVASPGHRRTTILCLSIVELLARIPKARVLVVVPTEELATRFSSTLEPFASHLQNVNFTCHTVVKTNSIQHDLDTLRRKAPSVIVGQPTRLAKLRTRDGAACIGDCHLGLVFQAEDLLEDGKDQVFPHDLMTLVGTAKQKVFCSSTVLPANSTPFASGAVFIKVKATKPGMENVWPLFFKVDKNADEARKLAALLPLHRTLVIEQLIVFCAHATSAQIIAEFLRREGFTTLLLLACEGKVKRDQALSELRSKKVKALVTDTDVTSDPFDPVDDVDMVVHMNMAGSSSEFRNRSGRYGRGPRKRLAVSFSTGDEDEDQLEVFQKELGIELIEIDDDRPPDDTAEHKLV